MAQARKRLLIIDANSLIHRAFHALPPLSTSKGEMTNAVYGFLLALFKAIESFTPDYIAAAFDHPAPTKRAGKFTAYKAKREKAPDELYGQIPKVKAVLEAFHVPVFEQEGFEADDIIGTLARIVPRRQVEPQVETVVLSGDMDLLQLVDKHTKVYTMKKGIKDTVLFGEKDVAERFGVKPAMLPDWKGLRGDPSDNIPGVRGVGEKTATRLLSSFDSLESLYTALEKGREVRGATEKLKNALLEEQDTALLSKELATIDREVPIEFRLPALAWQGFDKNAAAQALQDLEMGSLVSRIPGIGKAREEKPAEDGVKERIEKLFAEGVLSEQVYELELKLSPFLRAMEETGIKIDKKFFGTLAKDIAKQLSALERAIIKKAGAEFNVNSPKQLSEALFEGMGISSRGLRKTAGGVVSTASSELEKLQDEHPIIETILEWRELAKLQSTYILPLPKLADKSSRIHTTFDQLGAATGRLSSSSPNLQNIPLQGEQGKKIRKGFIAEQGYSLVSFDYSQADLRIASHIAKEEKLQDVFLQGKDVHTETAAIVFRVAEKEVTPAMRFRAKALNFGILYGMGARGFAKSARIPYEEAQDFIENYFVQFPRIKRYMEDTISFVREYGYAETLFGRKRHLPDIHSSTPFIRAAAERVAINHPIQGTQADIMKMAMVKVAEALRLQRRNCRMLLQIHDELLFEIADDIVEKQAEVIAELMEHTVSLKVPLIVKTSAGRTWGDMTPIQ